MKSKWLLLIILIISSTLSAQIVDHYTTKIDSIYLLDTNKNLYKIWITITNNTNRDDTLILYNIIKEKVNTKESIKAKNKIRGNNINILQECGDSINIILYDSLGDYGNIGPKWPPEIRGSNTWSFDWVSPHNEIYFRQGENLNFLFKINVNLKKISFINLIFYESQRIEKDNVKIIRHYLCLPVTNYK